MSDYELHLLCQKSPPLHGSELDDTAINDSGKLRVLHHLLKLKSQEVGLPLSLASNQKQRDAGRGAMAGEGSGVGPCLGWGPESRCLAGL
jgi:hypothetical protein